MNAKKMFEELGYNLYENDCPITIEYIKNNEKPHQYSESIIFHNQPCDEFKNIQFTSDYDSRCEWENECINCMCKDTIHCSKNKKGYNLFFVDIKLNIAINQQMKELGWLDE
jgi:hypothetical protein